MYTSNDIKALKLVKLKCDVAIFYLLMTLKT